MSETAVELVNRILRDHEGYAGDGRGGRGDLPIGDPTTPVRPIWKRDLRQALIGSMEDFDRRYLGGFPSAPTVDLKGDPLEAGAMYFDTSASSLRVYDGANWINLSTVNALLAAANLSDVANTATARANLGLDAGATMPRANLAEARDRGQNSRILTPQSAAWAFSPELLSTYSFNTPAENLKVSGLVHDDIGDCVTLSFKFTPINTASLRLSVAFSEDGGATFRTNLVPISVEKDWSAGVSGVITIRQVFNDVFSAETGSPFNSDQFFFPNYRVTVGGVAVLSESVDCIAFAFVDNALGATVDMASGEFTAVRRNRT